MIWAVCSEWSRGSLISRPRNGCSSESRKKTGPTRSLIPHWVTITRASRVARLRSSATPADRSSKTSRSAARPPRATASMALMSRS